jgi:isoamylase
LAASEETSSPLFIVLNAAHEEIEFTFPEWPNVQSWALALETTEQMSETGGGPGHNAKSPGLSVTVYEGRA